MKVNFVPKRLPVVTGEWLKRLLPGGRVDEWGAVLDVQSSEGAIIINGLRVPTDELEYVIKRMGNTLHAVTPEGLLPLVVRSRHFYKLRGLEEPGPPTLEIDGVHMHRIAGTDPWKDALSKVRNARVRSGHKVLDTCMGLGYTAIASLRRGATVVTVEKDPNVIQLAEWNPWSWELVKAEIYNDDVSTFIKRVEDETFDRIIHDPPVITMAGELYSREFYEELYRVLKRGGVLFHYTGSPKRRSGVDLARGVMERLREAGFEEVRRAPDALGVVARKSR
ncbi:class I SAM-dependent methyltransferase [Ignicoccus hospitalis]|uniref:class I SAM-dependent methyltransferase n=1 Tax=Ignicoccus hospitalis TaxID=160233 RepID=UPI001930BE8B|nr:methyltransferase domain-containing protein [Ignicoccus hospitalis]